MKCDACPVRNVPVECWAGTQGLERVCELIRDGNKEYSDFVEAASINPEYAESRLKSELPEDPPPDSELAGEESSASFFGFRTQLDSDPSLSVDPSSAAASDGPVSAAFASAAARESLSKTSYKDFRRLLDAARKCPHLGPEVSCSCSMKVNICLAGKGHRSIHDPNRTDTTEAECVRCLKEQESANNGEYASP